MLGFQQNFLDVDFSIDQTEPKRPLVHDINTEYHISHILMIYF